MPPPIHLLAASRPVMLNTSGELVRQLDDVDNQDSMYFELHCTLMVDAGWTFEPDIMPLAKTRHGKLTAE